jgi:hypothetical protein
MTLLSAAQEFSVVHGLIFGGPRLAAKNDYIFDGPDKPSKIFKAAEKRCVSVVYGSPKSHVHFPSERKGMKMSTSSPDFGRISSVRTYIFTKMFMREKPEYIMKVTN